LPQILPHLATLEVDDWPSFWSRREPGRLLSHQNFPALRVLSLSLDCDSDSPLRLVHGGGPNGEDPAFLSPLLTRLRLESWRKSPPSLKNTSWPRNAPLLIALPSLASLAPTLVSLSVGQPWAIPFPPPTCSTSPGDRSTNDDNSDAPCVTSHEELYEWAGKSNNERPPPEIEPMARLLPNLGPLSRLTSLYLESETDFTPGPVFGVNDGFFSERVKPEEQPVLRQLVRLRRSEWESGARRVLSPSSRTLARLEINARIDMGQPVSLPACLSILTALTSLVVRCSRLDEVGVGLRTLTALRYLKFGVTR